MERKLATIRKIKKIEPIQNADRIELARVDGWQSVIKKGECKEGDLVIFIEIDSILPLTSWSAFLQDKNRPDKPIRVKTCKLKGTLSQGIIVPLDVLPIDAGIVFEDGLDVTSLLGIEKHEPPIPVNLAGVQKSTFPSHLFPKTDSERIQNLWGEEFLDSICGVPFVARVKEDGTSFSAYYHNGECGVCSRNMELKMTEDNKDNLYVKMFYKYKLNDLFRLIGKNIAIQAEAVGPGIQKNRSGLAEQQIRVFDVYDIDNHRYYDFVELLNFCIDYDLPQVQTVGIIILNKSTTLDGLFEMTVRNYEGTNNQIEGLVFTSLKESYSKILNSRLRFKVINPDYLIENE
jgi:RNA ligase (TIGR02306 family)